MCAIIRSSCNSHSLLFVTRSNNICFLRRATLSTRKHLCAHNRLSIILYSYTNMHSPLVHNNITSASCGGLRCPPANIAQTMLHSDVHPHSRLLPTTTTLIRSSHLLVHSQALSLRCTPVFVLHSIIIFKLCCCCCCCCLCCCCWC